VRLTGADYSTSWREINRKYNAQAVGRAAKQASHTSELLCEILVPN